FLKRVREVCLQAYAHQDMPFEKLVAELQPERDLSRQPLFQVMLTLNNTPTTDLSLPGIVLTPVGGQHCTSKFDLAINAIEIEHGVSGWLEYSTDLFDASTIQRLI